VGGLKVMNDSGANSRSSQHSPSSPTKHSISNKENSYDRGVEESSLGTLKGSMAPPPLPKTPSPTKRSSQVLHSPTVAAKVPLPQTPTRKPVAAQQSNLQSPGRSDHVPGTSPKPPATPQTPRLLNDDFLQQSIASDVSQYMKGLSLQDQPIPQPKLQQSSQQQSPQPVTGVPPFDGHQSEAATMQGRRPSFSSSQSFNELYQKPLPNFAPASSNGTQLADSQSSMESSRGTSTTPSQTSISASSTEHSRSSTSAPASSAPDQVPPQDQPVTALTSVIIPALEAALHRRSYQLSILQKQHTASASSRTSSQSASEHAKLEHEIQLKRQGHDQIRKSMGKVLRLFKEIDHWDGVAPVGMGDGVEGVLEGFLEEVLCRVEAEDA
jgi:serine/threonine-protein kinase 24/25/MST4